MSQRPTIEELQKTHPIALDEFINIHKYQDYDFKDRQFLDIGSHIGFVTLLALAFGAKRTISVEPDRSNFIQLRDNLAPYPMATAMECAAHGFAKRIQLHDVSSNCKAVPADEGITAYPLETFVGLLDAGDDNMVLKVDAEGAEYDLLLNASGSTIRRFATIMLETHKTPHLNQHPARRAAFLRTYMEYLGYRVANEEPVCWFSATGAVTRLDDMIAYRMLREGRP